MLGLKDLTIDDIKALADVMNEKHIGRIELKNGESEIALDGRPPHREGIMPPPPVYQAPVFQAAPAIQPTAPIAAEEPAPAAPAPAAAEEKPAQQCSGNVVKAPIVGTYYSAPAPGKPPFVTVGQKVKKGDVIMIIESMKLMNEVQSEFDGVVAEIIAKDGQPVEFDQPVMIIK